ncbi:MAG: hypothetical protein ACEQSR_12030 [Candidatus Methylacidiphilales bacterium]
MKNIKKIVTTALIAVMGLFSYVAMAQRPNVPIMGIFDNPIEVPPLPCEGCPGSTVFTIKNNSKCKEFLKFVIGFTAQQGTSVSNPFALPDYFSSDGPVINITNSDIGGLLTGGAINTSQPYSLIEGGFDIYYFDPNTLSSTRMGNLLPGQSITVHYPRDSQNTERCKCYKLSWNEATNTVTIDDCI